MPKKMTHDLKETIIEALRVRGTMKYAARVVSVSVKTINEEMRRSDIFKRRVEEARAIGKANMADDSIEFIKDVAEGKIDVKMPRLTAALALANAYEPGFRGTTNVQGKIQHEVNVISAVPRPKYNEIEAPKVTVAEPKRLKSGKNKPAVEDVIEGVAVETKE